LYWQTGGVAADERAAGHQHLTAMDAGLGSGAAHVEGDGVLEPDAIAQSLGAGHACRGSGFHPDARALRLMNAEQAAGGLHDQEFACKAGGIEMVAHLAEIASHAWSDIAFAAAVEVRSNSRYSCDTRARP
jgi:hypothetical protein